MTAEIADVLSGARRWALLHADCLDVLPTLGDRSVAHVITDPPYEAEAHTKQRRLRGVTDIDGDRVLNVEPLAFIPITEAQRDLVGVHVARVTARWALVFCQVEAAMLWRGSLVCGNSGASTGFGYRRTCVWIKPDGMPQLTGDRPGMGYESIVACHRLGRSTWNGGGRVGVFVHNKGDNGGAKNEHPTTKPRSLMLELVSLFTDPDDIVLDPFAGSGTTGVACLRLGRRFIGIEKDATYAQLARDRLTAEERGSTLQAQRAGQEPLFR